MVSILSLLVVVALSILVTRIASVVLTHTGLSSETARFQARSAFTGVGFTTTESEKVVNHPVRRRVVLTLMLLGNAGFVTAMSSLIITFVGQEPGRFSFATKIVLLFTGLAVLWGFAWSRWVDARLSRAVEWTLRRHTDLDVRDYASLMRLGGDYRLAELSIAEDDWVADRTLGESRLRDEGVAVLGISRADGTYLGAPVAETKAVAGDTLLVYGRGEDIEELDRRRKGVEGDREHEQSAQERERLEREQATGDRGG